jgi:hypothetical protein
MSILDDAIREHLELKRAHGADAAELKKLEDEAFGPPARPDEVDAMAEAPTEFMATEGGEDAAESGGRRVPNIADLQEAPPQEEPEAPAAEEADLAEAPAEEEHPAMEHEVPDAEVEPAPGSEASHSTGEREAIAEQPTEHFDVEADLAGPEAPSPSDEELVDAELTEPRLSAVDPPAVEPTAADEVEEEDDFFSEQRLSDELSRALDAPIEDEEDEFAALGDEEEYEDEADDAESTDEDEEPPQPAASSSHEDVLEDTPDFLEDTPEDDDLWFEQRPPKDFDFDD